MSDNLYLIAHKVRGEPAFDIAQHIKCPICEAVMQGLDHGSISPGCDECDGEGFWWIIPTSGHRAYPYWHCSIAAILIDDENAELIRALDQVPGLPSPWPDHYTTTERREPMIGSLLTRLGLRKPKAPINRRA